MSVIKIHMEQYPSTTRLSNHIYVRLNKRSIDTQVTKIE